MRLNHDRVRSHTAQDVLRRIDEQAVSRLARYASAEPQAISRRLDDLDQEWDTDRAIELEASMMGLVGLALGVLVRPALLALPAAVGSAVLVHAVAGWYPLLPVFRRMGLRTAREIHRERYALKALRGDFADMGLSSVGADGPSAAPSPAGATRLQ